MKSEILKMLRNADGYVSGQEICDRFSVSRTAVWKAINQLKEDGYEIEAVRNKGYRIINSPDALTKEEIESFLSTKWVGQKLFCFEETDSTNLVLKRMSEEEEVHGATAVADKQTAGRGRRGRSWSSPSGTGIFFSIRLKPEISPNNAPMLTIVKAYSIVKAIRRVTGLDVKIKWPNDIVYNGKKICGILTEMSAEVDFVHYVIIGSGINVNTEQFPDDIKDTATSLYIESGKKVRRAKLVAEVLKQFEQDYERFMKDGDLSGMREELNEMMVNCGRRVRVLQPGDEYDGTALGIDDAGNLLVEKEDGTIMNVYAGEVSVRGIYGYV